MQLPILVLYFLANLIKSQVTLLPSGRSRLARSFCQSIHSIVGCVCQSERPTISWNTQDDLLSRGTQLDEVVNGPFHIQFGSLHIQCSGFRFERRVVVRFRVERGVVIVAEHIQKIGKPACGHCSVSKSAMATELVLLGHSLRDGRYVEALVDVVLASGHCHTYQESLFAVGQLLVVEGISNFLET